MKATRSQASGGSRKLTRRVSLRRHGTARHGTARHGTDDSHKEITKVNENHGQDDANYIASSLPEPSISTPNKPIQLESLINVARIGAWSKVVALISAIEGGTDDPARSRCLNAAALLVEGYLAFGPKKIEIYHACRGELCRLLIWAQFEAPSEKTLILCHEALIAVQSLIINLTKRKQGPRKDTKVKVDQ